MIYIQPSSITKATLGRLPVYLKHLESLNPKDTDTISATAIARELGYGEIQVRKDLSSVSGIGRPKIGYLTKELLEALRAILCHSSSKSAVAVGAGRLGKALLEYEGFSAYGLTISAAFDIDKEKTGTSHAGKKILHSSELEDFIKKENIRIGIITVPESAAQSVCNDLVNYGIEAIWNFAPCTLSVPDNVILQQENLALSLAHLSLSLGGIQ